MEIDGDTHTHTRAHASSPSLPSYCSSHGVDSPAHTRTYFLSLCELCEIHPQQPCASANARESFSRFILSGQRFTAEHAASPASAGGGLLFRGIICSHPIFISCWEIRDDKLFWWANNAPRWSVLFCSHATMRVHINKATHGRACAYRPKGVSWINAHSVTGLVNNVSSCVKI